MWVILLENASRGWSALHEYMQYTIYIHNIYIQYILRKVCVESYIYDALM